MNIQNKAAGFTGFNKYDESKTAFTELNGIWGTAQ